MAVTFDFELDATTDTVWFSTKCFKCQVNVKPKTVAVVFLFECVFFILFLHKLLLNGFHSLLVFYYEEENCFLHAGSKNYW